MENKANLVELDRNYRHVMDMIIGAGGELTPESEAALDQTFAALCTKVDGYGVICERLKMEMELWKHHKEQCSQAEKVYGNALQRLRDRMKYVLQAQPDRSLEGELFRFFLAKAKDSVVIEEEALPQKYKTVRMILEPNKELIEAQLRVGTAIPGAKLKTDNVTLRTGKPKI